MRLSRRIFAIALLAALAVLAVPRRAEGSVTVSVSVFHERLSPYGSWVVAGSYGNCWVPSRVASGWAPYVYGEWLWTDYGWTWASSDPWGDLPFHYGSWAWVDPYGWVWVPGTVWAPAWVTWAYTDSYVGWAPLPPSFVFTANGYVGGPVVVASSRYCFVPTTSFVGVSVASARVPVAQNATFLSTASKTTQFSVAGGVVHTAGPPVTRIETAAGHKIERASIERVSTRPTTLAAGGMTKSGRIAVVAPASERARVIHASTSASPKTASAQTEKAHETRATASPAGKTTHETTATAHKEKAAPAHVEKSAAAPAHKEKTAPVGTGTHKEKPAPVHTEKTATVHTQTGKAHAPTGVAVSENANTHTHKEKPLAAHAPKEKPAPARAEKTASAGPTASHSTIKHSEAKPAPARAAVPPERRPVTHVAAGGERSQAAAPAQSQPQPQRQQVQSPPAPVKAQPAPAPKKEKEKGQQ